MEKEPRQKWSKGDKERINFSLTKWMMNNKNECGGNCDAMDETETHQASLMLIIWKTRQKIRLNKLKFCLVSFKSIHFSTWKLYFLGFFPLLCHSYLKTQKLSSSLIGYWETDRINHLIFKNNIIRWTKILC